MTRARTPFNEVLRQASPGAVEEQSGVHVGGESGHIADPPLDERRVPSEHMPASLTDPRRPDRTTPPLASRPDPDDDTPSGFGNMRALVTGGSRGIGRAVAAQLLRAGAHVVVTSRTEAGAANACDALIAELGHVVAPRVHGAVCDVTRAESVD